MLHCLHEYGIQTEKSDTRVHVCVLAKKVYCYPTSQGLLVMHNYPIVKAKVNGEVTGEGHRVPVHAIPMLRRLRAEPEWFDVFGSEQHWRSEEDKGHLAKEIVLRIIHNFDFPYWPKDVKEVTEKHLQLDGQDILLGPSRIQVKCDWRGGVGPGCTGNLFLQIRERNKHGKY